MPRISKNENKNKSQDKIDLSNENSLIDLSSTEIKKLIIKWIGYNPSDKSINEIKYNFYDLLNRKLNDKQRI